MSRSAIEGYETVEGTAAEAGTEAVAGAAPVTGTEPVTSTAPADGKQAAARPETVMFRRRSLQPSRRAMLHVQAAGDPVVPSDVADWFTERAFHFYLAGLRVPHRLTGRPGTRSLASACADLEGACAQLRQADGIGSVIVAAQGRGALAAALWMGGRAAGNDRADALILYEPELPARSVRLSISCPVLVVTGISLADDGRGPRDAMSRWPLRQRRPAPAAAQLGSHVTLLHLPRPDERPGQDDGDGRTLFFDELGRWLGAYMYGSVRDQLL
jgi:hypothetical protein